MTATARKSRFTTADAYAAEVAYNLVNRHGYSRQRAMSTVNGAEVWIRKSHESRTDPAFVASRLARGYAAGTTAKKRVGYVTGRARAANEGIMPEAIINRRPGYAEPMLEVSQAAVVCTADPQQPLLAMPADQFDAHYPMGGVPHVTEADIRDATVFIAEVVEKKGRGKGEKRLVSTGVISGLMEAGRNINKNPRRGNAALDALALIFKQTAPNGGRVVVPTQKGTVGKDVTWMSGAAQMVENSGNTKLRKELSEISTRVVRGGLTDAARGPSHAVPEMTTRPRRGLERMTLTTMASIAATCPTSCALMGSKGGRGVASDTACYVLMHQNLGPLNTILNGIADRLNESPTDVAHDEAACIDASFRNGFYAPFDLRIHTSGDTRTREGARAISAAVRRWQARGGGSAWGYTHAWKSVARSDWGSVSILASVQNPSEAAAAKAAGWFPTCVVKKGLFHALMNRQKLSRREEQLANEAWVAKQDGPKAPKAPKANASPAEKARYNAAVAEYEQFVKLNPLRNREDELYTKKQKLDAMKRSHERSHEPVQSVSGDFGAFKIKGDDTIWIPCPAQNPDPAKQLACVNCRMCMNDQRYIGKNIGIAFEAHASGAKRAVTYEHGERIVKQANARVTGEAQHDMSSNRLPPMAPPRRRLPVLGK